MDHSHMPFMCNSSLSTCKNSNKGHVGSRFLADTTLSLSSHCAVLPDIFDLGASKEGSNGLFSLKNEISLTLELGCSDSCSEKKTNIAAPEVQPSDDMCVDFSLNIGTNRACKETGIRSARFDGLEGARPMIDLELSLSNAATESDVTSVTLTSSDIVQHVDDGSTSSKWKHGPRLPLSEMQQTTQRAMSVPSVYIPSPESFGAGKSTKKPSRKTVVKACQFPGCEKGARGASGRCIAHGGGRRCQRPGCQKGAEGRTAFCKAHGGGRRCEHLGCTKSAEGRTNLCIAHGGGKRCSFPEGCACAARGRSGLCIRHGGGKRCKIEDCSKSAEGLSGLCIAHGGGRRCEFPQCTKGAQGSTKFCKAHGGGKRCTFLGCTKGAEGRTPFCKGHGGGKRCSFQGGGVCTKSVHGGTLFCVSHGGGKRCAIQGCTKSARGRTNFCVRHGGGKRCKFEGCGKSAQGSTDFCKAHGGGKRCLWGQPGSDFGDGDNPCDKFARGKFGLCAAHAAQVHDKRVHGDGIVGLKMKEIITSDLVEYSNNTVEEHTNVFKGFDSGRHGHHWIPPQPTPPGGEPSAGQTSGPSASKSLPEGRVHGGSLMAMLRGGADIGAV